MNRNYNSDELLSLCTVNPWRDVRQSTALDQLVSDILAIVVTEKSPEGLQQKIKDKIYDHSTVSIGSALGRLHTISNFDRDLKGNADGIDALAYHLSGNSCEQGISALQKVLKRFADTDNRLIVEDENVKADSK